MRIVKFVGLVSVPALTTPATIGATEEVRDTGNQTSGGVEIYEGITYSNDDTQPFLTRAEASQLPNGIALVWDAHAKRAVGGSSSGSSVIPTSTTVINNIPIANNSAIKVMFTADISDTNATGGITPLTITYNSVSIPVKANKNGALVDVLAKEVQTNIWKYLQAYTTLELVYQSDYDGQGNSAFIITGNPILLSDTDYIIYANGQIECLNYSTDEVATGKKWIDGKMIYRKVFYNITLTNGLELQTGVNELINQYGTMTNDNTIYIPFPKDAGIAFCTARLNVSTHKVIIDASNTYYGRITLEYTKAN